MSASVDRCCVKRMRDYHYVQCSRRATVQEGGKFYCTQHSPAKVAAARTARRAKWEAEYDEQARKDRREQAERGIGRAVLVRVEAHGDHDLPPWLQSVIAVARGEP